VSENESKKSTPSPATTVKQTNTRPQNTTKATSAPRTPPQVPPILSARDSDWLVIGHREAEYEIRLAVITTDTTEQKYILPNTPLMKRCSLCDYERKENFTELVPVTTASGDPQLMARFFGLLKTANSLNVDPDERIKDLDNNGVPVVLTAAQWTKLSSFTAPQKATFVQTLLKHITSHYKKTSHIMKKLVIL
jgi:hypothetical protein